MATIKHRRNPWLAAGLSLLTLGLGQLYCGQHWRAIGFFCIYAAGVVVFAGFAFLINDLRDGLLLLPVALGFAIYSAVDAWRIAVESVL